MLLSKKGKYQRYLFVLSLLYFTFMFSVTVLADQSGSAAGTGNMWTVAEEVIKDVYKQIAGISTFLAGLMSAVAVVGAKMSNNQHKTDQAWDWLRRIWIAWAIINGIGAFIAYVAPFLQGYDTLTPGGGSSGGNSSGAL